MPVTIDGTAGVTFPDGVIQPTVALGVGQTYQDVTASRTAGTTYTNTTGRPIVATLIRASTTATSQAITAQITVAGVVAAHSVAFSSSTAYRTTASAIVPAGATYVYTEGGTGSSTFVELR